ncbi:hypothetical protein Tco_1554326 [Tanacetum coccineum]
MTHLKPVLLYLVLLYYEVTPLVTFPLLHILGVLYKGSSEGSGVIPKVPDGPSGSSSSSSLESKDNKGFLPTNDEESPDKSNDKKKQDDVVKDADAQAREEQPVDDQARKVQDDVHVPKPQVEKPAGQLLSSTLTLSSTEYGNQFINDNPDVSMNDVLKDPAEIEIQSMVEVAIGQEDPDPPVDADKDSKKRKRKDYDASPSKKSKDKEASSKEGKALSKSSKTDKAGDAEGTVQDDTMDAEELIEYDFVDTQEPTQDDAAPKQDRSKWFKHDVVERHKTSVPEWHKEPNADNAPE